MTRKLLIAALALLFPAGVWAQTATPTNTATPTTTPTPTVTPTSTPTLQTNPRLSHETVFKAMRIYDLDVDPPDASSGHETVTVHLDVPAIQPGDFLIVEPAADLEDDLSLKGYKIVANNRVKIDLYAGAAVNGASKKWTFKYWDRTSATPGRAPASTPTFTATPTATNTP